MKPAASSFPLRSLAAAVGATLICAAVPLPVQAAEPAGGQSASPRHYDIPAGSLAEVLSRFAGAADVTLVFDASQLSGLRSGGLRGAYAVPESFARLLAGSGYEAQQAGPQRYTLRRADSAAAANVRAPAAPARAAEDVIQLDSIVVTGQRSRDEVGHDNVYEKDIANVYVDRKYLDRHRGVSTGDVFAGMNGVYNTDNRNGSALFPNIRGQFGNGRIPVTVDGTEQSIDVWLGPRGINNRNYVDPNLFRDIAVEKGPSMTRGIKSGIGGSVSIRTLDADDIIPDGKNWGMELKLGVANNAIDPSFDAHSIEGMDYRDVPGAASAQPLLGTPGVMFYEPLTEQREKGDTFDFRDSRHATLTAAYRNDRFDVMGAYSHQRRGNYFAGREGAEDYMNNIKSVAEGWNAQTIQNMYPDIAKVFHPGYEVPYTASETESVMFKTNLKLPGEQKLAFSYSHHDLEFAELPFAVVDYFMGEAATNISANVDPIIKQLQYPFPNTTVDQNVFRLGYELKPTGSRWLDLETSLWRTNSKGSRYQTGDATYGVREHDQAWNQYVGCNYDDFYTSLPPFIYPLFCPGIVPGGPAPERAPNTDGRYDIRIGNRIDSHGTRTGFDVSNRFRLADGLNLTLAADWQHEKVRDNMPVTDIAVLMNGTFAQTYGPASGRREEYGGSLNMEWRPTSRLQLSAGARYGTYWGFDDETDKQRAAQNENWRIARVVAAQAVSFQRLMTDDELAMYRASGGDPVRWQEWKDYLAANHMNVDRVAPQRDFDTNLNYWDVIYPVALNDAKADHTQNPVYNGTVDLNQTADNPQGVAGTYKVYEPITPGNQGIFIEDLHPADPWKRPVKQSAHAWSSQFVASYLLGERSRAYARFASLARFPSILETANRLGFVRRDFAYSGLGPERNNAWEVGYTHDLSGLLPGLRRADVKLDWYHNTIHDYYDRSYTMTMIQFDRKISSGLELQSRFDTGRFYGGLSATYRLQQKMCDKDYAIMLDPHYHRIPECMDGGLPSTLSYSSLQPKYSVNLDLGTRLLQSKLDLGVRVRHHAKAENETVQQMLEEHQSGGFAAHGYAYPIIGLTGINRPFFWNAVTLLDLYAEYRINQGATMRLSVDNLTDRYYLDPLTKVVAPGPGRTVMLDVALKF